MFHETYVYIYKKQDFKEVFMYSNKLFSIKNIIKIKTKVIILKFDNINFKCKKHFYNIKMLNKKIIDYVKQATQNYPTSTISIKPQDNLVDLLTKYATKYHYIAVFYCDCPLLTPKVVSDSIDYASLKQLNICKLPRGYVFKCEFLKNYSPSQLMEVFTHYENEFLPINTPENLESTRQQLQTQIIKSLQHSGVTIINPSTSTIDSTVTIYANTTIFSNNHIYGNTQIYSGVTLHENNCITNCSIYKNCKLTACILNNCIVHKNITLNPFSCYKNKIIKVKNGNIIIADL